eukprot:TRINITY_DN64199_c0_g1_i4.p1 TRINITY_DN64199_c0_g1~~TRINITY_DN64199_c0_g1_i4.p1  ORF type:complete len:275 (+),score=34.77 TRINITY_DN64199_c0_g1_i4:72-827(+)
MEEVAVELSAFWESAAYWYTQGCGGAIGLVVLWFGMVNYIGAEEHHPLDWYSNKMRTRPYWFVLEVLFFGSVAAGLWFGSQLEFFCSLIPELLIAVDSLGLVIGVVVLFGESAAATLTAWAIYTFVSACIVIIIIIPTPPVSRPGLVYSSVFLVVNVLLVIWVELGVYRHLDREKRDPLIPVGSETMPRLWAKAVKRATPLLLIVTNLLYLSQSLVAQNNYGSAAAIVYYVVAVLLLLGCCGSYRADTVIE